MREILFRGKQCENSKWIIGYLSSKHTITIQTPCGHTDEIVICADTVGQFTGLTDKNGKKIFEGDICRFREWSKGEMCWVGKVHWEHQQFMITGGPNKECETMFELCMSRFIPESIEVIGNIHDNPELLETP